ncbi:unnamed protein product [Meganyctiphanes norvegica]|uniref:Uncharacterized protein n=1 Tax=Meganyctiphanes norvegica TaxID=48144 RepID=A0AAV2QLY2_MEGNR
MQAGARTDLQDNNGYMALSSAARSGHHEVVEQILSHDPNCKDAADDRGYTALHCAARSGHHLVVEVLIKHNCSKNALIHSGETALHLAARSGHKEVINTLIQSDIDISIKDSKSKTARDYLSKDKENYIEKLALERNKKV